MQGSGVDRIFFEGTKGSHRAFARRGEATLLNFQDRNGKIPTYQAEQLIDMIEKYEDEQ